MSDTPAAQGPRTGSDAQAPTDALMPSNHDTRILGSQSEVDRYKAMSVDDLLKDLDAARIHPYASMTVEQLKEDFDKASAALSVTIERGEAFVADIKAMKPLEQKQSMFSYLQGRISALFGLSPKPVSDAVRNSDPLLRVADDRVRILRNLDQMDVAASAPLVTDAANTRPTLRLVFDADRVAPEIPDVSAKDVEVVDVPKRDRSSVSVGQAAALIAGVVAAMGMGIAGTRQALATGDGGYDHKDKKKDKQYDEWCPEEPVPTTTTTVPVDTTTTTTTTTTTVPVDTTPSSSVPADTTPVSSVPADSTPTTTVFTGNPTTTVIVVEAPPVTWKLPETE